MKIVTKEILREKSEAFIKKCEDSSLTHLIGTIEDFENILENGNIGASISYYTGTSYNVGTLYSIEYFKKDMGSGIVNDIVYAKTICTYSGPDKKEYSLSEIL